MNYKKGLENKRCHDLRGKPFGLLTPIEVDNSRGRVYWKCKCSCGNEKLICAKHLVGGKITSCGCKQTRRGKLSPTWKGYEEISGKYWECLRRNAMERSLEFEITPAYAWDVFIRQNKRCALTGLELIFPSKVGAGDGTASLDRIDSTNGYIVGNIWWVDKKVNTIKWDLTLDNFLKTCKLVVDYNKL